MPRASNIVEMNRHSGGVECRSMVRRQLFAFVLSQLDPELISLVCELWAGGRSVQRI